MRFSNRSGTAAMWTMSRSLRRKPWAWRIEAVITKMRVCCGTWFRTTCSNYMPDSDGTDCGFSPDAVRDEKSKLLKSVRPIAPEEVAGAAVLGQYGPGKINGKEAV